MVDMSHMEWNYTNYESGEANKSSLISSVVFKAIEPPRRNSLQRDE